MGESSDEPGLPLSEGDPPGRIAKPGETVPVVGSEGKPIACDDGEPLMIDPVADDPPQDLIQTPATSDPSVLETVEGAVPRCDPEGGGPDASPVWVPESVGAEHPVNAPQRFVEMQAGGEPMAWAITLTGHLRRRRRAAGLATLAILAAGLIAGCEGDGGTTATSDVTFDSKVGLDGLSACLVAAKWKEVGEEQGTAGTTYTLDSPGGARVRFTTTVAGEQAPDGGYLIPDPEDGGLAVIVDEGSLTDTERETIDTCASGG